MAFGASGDLGPEAFLVGSVSSDSIASGIAQLEGCIRKHHAFHCVSLCFCLFHMLGLRSIIWGVAMHSVLAGISLRHRKALDLITKFFFKPSLSHDSINLAKKKTTEHGFH